MIRVGDKISIIQDSAYHRRVGRVLEVIRLREGGGYYAKDEQGSWYIPEKDCVPYHEGFQSGDRIRRKDGDTFSNDELVVTVDYMIGNKVWIKETGTFIDPFSIEVVGKSIRSEKELEEAYREIESLKKQLKTKNEIITKLLDL